jgi:hypothetical protein
MTRQPALLRPSSAGKAAPGSRPSAPGPVPRQRRRSILALGLVLTGLGVLVGAWTFTSFSHRIEALRAARSIPAGAQITAADLAPVAISVGSGVTLIPARQQAQVAGETAAVPIPEGSLLVPADLTTVPVPGPGQQLVPVALKASQLPAAGLVPGDQVLVVATPGAGGQAASTSTGSGQQPLNQAVPATVYRVSPPDDSDTVVVDLLVDAGQGPAVAQQDSTGQIALVVTPGGPGV